MQTEEESKQNQRFLFADEYFSDKAIEFWQTECIKRCKDKPKGQAYEKYITWKRQKNEIAVFTLYAYADFSIPKKFDIIFKLDNPSEFIKIDYELTQSIHEAWFPFDNVNDGHKHLCIFTFKETIPEILYTLNEGQEKYSRPSTRRQLLGFCNSNDFNSIKKRLEKELKLKEQYGEKWWEHDTEE